MADLRYALRMMRRSPGFTGVAVVTVALGIGANTAIFSLIDTIMLRTLPVRDPGELVEFLHSIPAEPEHRSNSFSSEHYVNIRNHSRAFTGVAAFAEARFEGVTGEYVDGNFFPLLGLRPTLGRLIGPQDEGSAAVAVVSWSYWNGTLHGDRSVVGKQILLHGVPNTIVGVAPRDFSGLRQGFPEDIWIPMPTQPKFAVGLVARLKHGVSMSQALAEMKVLDRRSPEEQAEVIRVNPMGRELKLEVEPAGAGLNTPARQRFARPLLLLMAVVGLLLLIACTNIASLLLARGEARQREMAIRVSLGAGRWRLMRQVLTESLLLSAAGSALGLCIAYFGADALLRIVASGHDPLDLHVTADLRVLLFTTGAALATGILFGLAPALSAMPSARRTGESRVGRRFGKSLVAAQVALSLVMLSAASLFIQHVVNLEHLDLGFRRDHLLLISLNTAGSGYNAERLLPPYQELLRRLSAIPGVRSASLSGVTPLSGTGASRNATVEGYQAKPGEFRLLTENWVAPKYFETLGTPLLAGRDFDSQDQGHARVAIINRTMAQYYFGSDSPIGKHFSFDKDDKAYEIIGVVGDSKYEDMREATWRSVYLSAFQDGRVSSHQFVLRTGTGPASLAGEVRAAVREVLHSVTIAKITTMEDQLDATIVPERLIALLSGSFGVLGALLTAIGLYGLLGYTVTRRINEIGVRMALGARQRDVVGMVLRDALGMVAVGLAFGIPFTLWARTAAANLVAGLPVESALPMLAGGAIMIGVALIAAWIPARRAARVDPMEALRYE